MLVATWNINGIRARLDFLRLWLRERRPDLVALQELKIAEADFPHDVLRLEGYHAAVHGQKGWNGVAVLAREEPRVVGRGLPGQDAAGSRLLAVEAAGLTFATVYVPNGKFVGHPDFPMKLAWLDALAAHVRDNGASRRSTLIGGDFNLCPGPLDTWNEEALTGTIFHTDEERSRFAKLLELGFRDVFRDRRPDAREFSWWDYRAGAFHRGLGLRIDLLLATPQLAERVRSVEIDRAWRKKKDGLVPSDHAPVLATLED